MVSTYANYKFLLSTLAYYARNKTKFDKILLEAMSVSKENETVSNRSRPLEGEVNYENDDGLTVDDIDEIEYVLNQDVTDSRVYYTSDIYVN